jgi:hypothetical protein
VAADRSGLTPADAQDEILAAACLALDKAHDLLSFLIRYDGQVTPQYVERVKAWVDGEYDPGTHRAKPCKHNWAKVVLGGEIMCTRCGIQASTDVQ